MISKGQAALYKRSPYRNEQVKKAALNISWRDVVILFLVFFMGRASIIGRLMPFGIAFLAVVFIFHRRDILLGITVITGMLMADFSFYAIRHILAVALLYPMFHLYVESERSKVDERSVIWRTAVSVLICVLISHIVFNVFSGITAYNTFLMLGEALIAFIFVFIFKNVQKVLFISVQRRILTSEEIIALGIFAALIIEGFFDINLWGISLKGVLSLFTVLTLGFIWGAGVGASLGITIGIIMLLPGTTSPHIIADLGFCGMLAGIFNQLGRWGSTGGFILGNAILTYYINGSKMVIVPFKEIVIAGIALMVLPRKTIELLKEYTGFSKLAAQRDYINKVKEFLNRRLTAFADMFQELSHTFDNGQQALQEPHRENASCVFDLMAQRICRRCSFCNLCWEQDFYIIYQDLFKLMAVIENKGRIDKDDIPATLRKRCVHINDVIRLLERVNEYYKLDRQWQQKIDESRRLVSEQLAGISKAIFELASDIDVYMDFDSAVEDALMVALDEKGIRVKNVTVVRNNDGRMEIEVVRQRCDGSVSCIGTIRAIVSKTLNKNFAVKTGHCLDQRRADCLMRLVEAERYSVMIGVARKIRCGSSVGGDSYTFLPLKNGQYIMAVSDGMGTGEKAAAESATAISLLEQMLETGFDQQLIIKTINSILMLKNSDEIFTTMDMCLLNMMDGVAEFIKIGACPSFIKSGDYVEIVRSASLPIGIVTDLAFDRIKRKFKAGDFIVLITDGVLDANKGVEDKERWLSSVIENMNTPNPQEMAERILNAALEADDQDGPADDMTVLVSRLWENV